MKFKDAFLFTIEIMGVYLALSAVEILLLKSLIDFVSTSFMFHLGFYVVCLFIINPLLTWLIGKLLPFYPPELINEEDVGE